MSKVAVLVGTTKGAFLLHADPARQRFSIDGPHFKGNAVYALAFDGRAGRRRLWAATESAHFGALLRSSDDLGATWTEPIEANIKFPVETGLSLAQIWQITPGRASEPDTLYCGVAPAALFVSKDAGATWTLNQGLFDHPHRPRWEPGGGGLCLHTILLHPDDPRRMLIAISTGGVYLTDDAGETWHASNRGVRAQFLPDPHPEFGQCVHKVASHPSQPERFYLQNHWGLYRSDDGGASWRDIAAGVPSDFGFPMVVHPLEPDTAFIVPLESDGFRCTPEGKLRVYRTRNGGESWEPLTRGLPQAHAFECVLRDGMAMDAAKPASLYFGTRSGKLFGSDPADESGDSFRLVAEGLPPITCVKTALLAT